MLIKIHKLYRDIVAVCDSELLGKCYEEGKKILDVRESFYNGEEVEENKAVKMMKDMAAEDATFSIVGKKSCEAALKAGIISKEGIKKVKGIPFALVLM
ncbi:MAG: DUF424 family protein [Nanoarchaeota archaeon]